MNNDDNEINREITILFSENVVKYLKIHGHSEFAKTITSKTKSFKTNENVSGVIFIETIIYELYRYLSMLEEELGTYHNYLDEITEGFIKSNILFNSIKIEDRHGIHNTNDYIKEIENFIVFKQEVVEILSTADSYGFHFQKLGENNEKG